MVAEAANGFECLAMIKEKTPDLIITDVSMPGLDGVGLLTRLNEAPGGLAIPALVVTGSRDKEMMEKLFTLGAADIVNKPVDENELIPRVNRILTMDWE
jgi:CheY-like chemotaxis protein